MENKHFFRKVVPSGQGFGAGYCGLFRFRFYRHGEWHEVENTFCQMFWSHFFSFDNVLLWGGNRRLPADKERSTSFSPRRPTQWVLARALWEGLHLSSPSLWIFKKPIFAKLAKSMTFLHPRHMQSSMGATPTLRVVLALTRVLTSQVWNKLWFCH